jgi:hypothetical protein
LAFAEIHLTIIKSPRPRTFARRSRCRRSRAARAGRG